jgi:hypothetical protein
MLGVAQPLQEFVDTLKQCVRITVNARDCIALAFGQRRFAVALKDLAKADNCVQWRAKLVRHVADVIGFQFILC